MKINRINDLRVKYDSLYKFVILMFIIFLYAYYEKRIYSEAVFVAVFGIYFITNKKRPTLYTLWNLFFLVISFMSVFWSVTPSVSLQMTRKILEIGIIGNLLIAYLDNKEKIIFIYKSFVWAGLVLIFRLLITFPISVWGAERLGDSVLNANRIGLHLAISSIFAFYLAKALKQKKYYILTILFFVVIALTGSRKAFVMLLMGISLLHYVNSNKLSRKIKSLLIITLIVFLGYYSVMNIPEFYDVLGYRIERMINTFIGEGPADNSTRLRELMIDTGLTLYKKNPFKGYGIATYSSVSGFGMYSHNNYIELLVGVGAVGLVVYYSLYFLIVKNLYKSKEFVLGNPLLVVIILLVLMEYGLVSYYGEVYQIILITGYAVSRMNKFNLKSKNGGNDYNEYFS